MGQWNTACPLNCYDVCGLKVSTLNDKIKKIEGDNNHSITRGKICGKGKLLKERIYDSRRILYPYKKIDSKFVRISWDQAINEISEKMQKYKTEYGETAILHSYDYSSGGLLKGLDQRFFNYFGGYTEVRGSLCWGAGIQGQAYDFGDSLSHDVKDIINAKSIVIWGRNITTTNIHLYPYLLEAKRKGAKIIVIDPVKNIIAKKADIYLNINPGMDGILASLISKIIIENSWHDQNFIKNYSIGFDSFYNEIKSINNNDISKEIGIELNLIKKLANIYALEKPVMTFLGLGMQRYSNGGNSVRAIDALSALTGNIGISGGGIQYANLSVGRMFNWNELLRDDLRNSYRVFSRPNQAEEIINVNTPPIKMAFITRSNAFTQLPNTKRTIKAFESIETKVVLDMFMTDTAKCADYLLPIASVFEEEDIYYGSMFHNIIRYGPKIVEPRGEAWSDLKIWIELAKELGMKEFIKSNKEYFEIAMSSLNKYGIDFNTLKEKGEIELPVEAIPWKNKKFNTPSGKFEFYSEQAKKAGINPTAIISYPSESNFNQKELKEKYPYNLLSIHPTKSLHSQHHMFNKNKDKKAEILMSSKTAKTNKIKDGELVKVFNNRGTLFGKAKIHPEINDNVILIEEGWWLDTDSSSNLLTSNENSDMGSGSIIYDCAVMIDKIV